MTSPPVIQAQSSRKKRWLFLVKLLLTGLALGFVFTKIDFWGTWALIRQVHIGWVFAAFAAFNVSKIISAFRLNVFFRTIHLYLSSAYNLGLYYIGMFYNLFLPGSIGGDGYKVYVLRQQFGTPIKDLVGATLLDRINGLVALSFLAGILLYFSHYTTPFPTFSILLILATAAIYPSFYLAGWLFFRKFYPAFHRTNLQSLGVQALQVVCAACLLRALSIHENQTDYLALFMVSSVVAVLPFTVGGVGARELVFLLGYQYLPIDRTAAVSFTLLFFATTAACSLIGLPLVFRKERKGGNEEMSLGVRSEEIEDRSKR